MVGRPLLALSSPSPPSSPRHSTQSKIPIPITYKSEYYLTAYLASHFLEPRASSSSPRARADRDVPKKNGVLALPRPRARPKDTARNGRNLIGTSQVATCPTPHSDGGRTAAQPSAAAEAAADAADAVASRAETRRRPAGVTDGDDDLLGSKCLSSCTRPLAKRSISSSHEREQGQREENTTTTCVASGRRAPWAKRRWSSAACSGLIGSTDEPA